MRELLELVNEWDPAGLLAVGAPGDEYECLAGPLLSRLVHGATSSELAGWLNSHVAEHFGVVPADPQPFVQKAQAWYQSRSQMPGAS